MKRDSARSPLPGSAGERPVVLHSTQSSDNNAVHASAAQRCLRSICAFLLRLDVLWTFLFAAFMFAAVTPTVSTVKRTIYPTMDDSWWSLHNLRVAVVSATYDKMAERIYRLAATSMSLNGESPFAMGDESTLTTLCAPLVAYDLASRFLSFSIFSPSAGALVSCLRGSSTTRPSPVLTGIVSGPDGYDGIYYINTTTYTFERPLVPATMIYVSRARLIAYMQRVVARNDFFNIAMAYYSKDISFVDPRLMWTPDHSAPNLIYFTFPAALAMRDLDVDPGDNITNYLRITLQGSMLAETKGFEVQAGESLMVLINGSLTDADPIVMSNSWGQESVNDTSAFAGVMRLNLSYLHCSNITDPLMRAALRHVNLAALQTAGNTQVSRFPYGGSYATVTAISYTTPRGLTIPFVYASPQSPLLPPHRYLTHIFYSCLLATIILMTGVLWYYLHYHISRPLMRMAELLHRTVETGQRELFRHDGRGFLRNAEVEELVVAHNDAMRRLHEIDAFVPVALRKPCKHCRTAEFSMTSMLSRENKEAASEADPAAEQPLMAYLSTIVTVTIRKNSSAGHDTQVRPGQPAARSRVQEGATGGRLLDNILTAAMVPASIVNSGPFSSPSVLEAFVTAVSEFASAHHGTVLRLCPDVCVLHFGASTRTHLTSPAAVAARAAKQRGSELTPEDQLNAATVRRELAACVRRDAADAVAFALTLQRWVGRLARRVRMPDVRALLDTSSFTCGVYRSEPSEHAMAVAIGRDVHRDLGHVAALIGVRVAMTEETASLVRARVSGWGMRRVEPGVRQLPVEALRTGRVGRNADVVILYEVLPGAVAGDAAWQRYSRCCFDAFECMLHGDYVAALSSLKNVAEIADLEPGLMPRSLGRETARSGAVGGAVSTQAERLMKECERHIAARDTTPYYRHRRCPLAVETVLRGPLNDSMNDTLPCFDETARASSSSTHLSRFSGGGGFSPAPVRTAAQIVERYILTTAVGGNGELERRVVGGRPEWVEDSYGSVWSVSRSSSSAICSDAWFTTCAALGSAGTLCTMTLIPFRSVPDVISRAIQNAPEGKMSAALRSRVPLLAPSPHIKAAVERLFRKKHVIAHPNVLSPLAYSLSVEGGVASFHEHCPGGNLRSLYSRYSRVHLLTSVRFALDISAGLAALHKRGLAHGMLCLDTVMVSATGVCRLYHHCLRSPLWQQTFWSPATCYVSPAMARGEPPTPACDIFCYGLMFIETVARGPCWRWADSEEEKRESTSEGDAEKAAELTALLQRGGQPFNDALVQGRVVPALEAADLPEVARLLTAAEKDVVRRCLLEDPSKRPTAPQLREVNMAILARNGFTVDESVWKSS